MEGDVGPVLALDGADQPTRLEEPDHNADVTRHAVLGQVVDHLLGAREADLGALVAHDLRQAPRARAKRAVLVHVLGPLQKSQSHAAVALVAVLRRLAPLGNGETGLHGGLKLPSLTGLGQLAVEDVSLEQEVRRATILLGRLAAGLHLHQRQHPSLRDASRVGGGGDLQCYPVAEHVMLSISIAHSAVGSPSMVPVMPPDRLRQCGSISVFLFSH